MFKILLFLLVIGYVFRKVLFTPIPGSTRSDRMHNDKADTQGFTDYEELD